MCIYLVWDVGAMVIIQVMSQRNITYHFKDGTSKTAMLQSTYFELPLLFKYKSKRHKNVMFYMIGGFGYRYNLAMMPKPKEVQQNQ